MNAARELLVAALLLLGAAAMTLSVRGIVLIPNPYVKIHAAAKAVTLGVLPMVLAALVAGPIALGLRAVLAGIFLVWTSAVGAHALARLESQRRKSGGPHPAAGSRPPP